VNREQFLAALLGLATLSAVGCAESTVAGPNENGETGPNDFELQKSEAEWRSLLTPAAFRVLFQNGTETPYTSPLNDEHRAGQFLCAACFVPLFDSGSKYDSGTGWPSFWDPIPTRLGLGRDLTAGFERTEYHCARCGGHQGHVFDDGPQPTGKRYCNNGVALRFVAQGETPPLLRN
jgi:peptide-methionine (R)-S-oxide reductase